MSETSTSPEQATADQIKDLLAQLTESQRSFDEWRKTQPITFDKEMAAWIYIRDRQRFYSADEVTAWKGQEPGISSRPEVIETRRRIAELEVELHNQKSRLKELLSIGTPYSTCHAAVENSEGMVSGILQRLKKNRVEKVLIDTYGHSNVARLPRALTDAARLHPSVTILETLAFNPRLASLRDSQINQQVVDAAATNAGKALTELLDLVSSKQGRDPPVLLFSPHNITVISWSSRTVNSGKEVSFSSVTLT